MGQAASGCCDKRDENFKRASGRLPSRSSNLIPIFVYSSRVPPSITHSPSPFCFASDPIVSPFCLCFQPKTQLLNLIKHRRAEGCGKFAVQWPVIRSKVTARLGGDLQQINGENLLLQQVCDVSMWAMRCVIHSATDAFSLTFYTLQGIECNLRSQSPVSVLACVLQVLWVFIYIYFCVHHPIVITQTQQSRKKS